VHTSFNQSVARTGRLSSSSPNLQNIPTLENDIFGIRNAFVASKGFKLVVIDYQALEMRLLAAASMEPDMIQIFLDGKDIHMGNASLIFDIPYDDIVKAKKIDKKVKEKELPPEAMTPYVQRCMAARSQAKTIGFGQR
jgi:DNA polymerase-1